jgi:hypothetical protein
MVGRLPRAARAALVVCAFVAVLGAGIAVYTAWSATGPAWNASDPSAAVIGESPDHAVLPARRTITHGTHGALVLALATLAAAWAVAPARSARSRRPALTGWTPALIRVPRGTRAPPARRV